MPRYAVLLACLTAIAMFSTGCAVITSKLAEHNAPSSGAFVEVDGVRLHYLLLEPETPGPAARDVVMIHGATANLRDLAISIAPETAKRSRVLLFDRPGFGYSQRGPENAHDPMVQAKLLRDAAAKLGVTRPVVLGQSLGGAVALAWALEFPDDLSGLVLVAPVSHRWPGGVAWYNALADTPVAGFVFRETLVPLIGATRGRGGVAGAFQPNEPPHDYYRRAGVGLYFRPKTFGANASDITHLKAHVTAMSRRYGEIRVPVRIVTGKADTVVSPKLHSQALAAEIPGARLVLLDGVGHQPHHIAPGAVIEAIDAVR